MVAPTIFTGGYEQTLNRVQYDAAKIDSKSQSSPEYPNLILRVVKVSANCFKIRAINVDDVPLEVDRFKCVSKAQIECLHLNESHQSLHPRLKGMTFAIETMEEKSVDVMQAGVLYRLKRTA